MTGKRGIVYNKRSAICLSRRNIPIRPTSQSGLLPYLKRGRNIPAVASTSSGETVIDRLEINDGSVVQTALPSSLSYLRLNPVQSVRQSPSDNICTSFSIRRCHTWVSCNTDISAVQDQPVMSPRQQLFGDMFDKLAFGFKRRFRVVRQSNPVRDPEYVGIYRHGREIERNGQYHVGRLSAYPRNGEQFVEG